MKWVIPVLASILIMGGFGITQQAFAVPTSVFFADDPPSCDFLFNGPDFGDELGLGALSGPFPFPPDEEIDAFVFSSSPPACPSGSIGITVEITNLTPHFWFELFYVADSDTVISNFDGTIDGFLAFRIDSPASLGGCGINCPLIFESLTPDGVFEPGEIWEFIIDDYANFDIFGPLPPDALGSLGIGSFDSGSPTASSGSIFAFGDTSGVGGTILPIDTTALLVAGAQTTTPWLILGIVAAVGIGIAVFTLKRSR